MVSCKYFQSNEREREYAMTMYVKILSLETYVLKEMKGQALYIKIFSCVFKSLTGLRC